MIVGLANVSHDDLVDISSRVERQIDARIAQRVLAVTFHPSDDRKMTPGIGARRRICALVAMGFPFSELAHRLHVPRTMLESLPATGLIRVSFWRAVDHLYDELSMTMHAPDPAIRDWARDVQGWHPPLAWDDDEIDDYRARPHSPRGRASEDPVAIARRINGERSIVLNRADAEAIVSVAVDAKWTVTRLAEVLSCEVGTANSRMVRHRARVRSSAVAAESGTARVA